MSATDRKLRGTTVLDELCGLVSRANPKLENVNNRLIVFRRRAPQDLCEPEGSAAATERLRATRPQNPIARSFAD